MKHFMFYSREFILKKIEEKRDNVNYVECFIAGYYDDTKEVIFINNKYVIDVDAERYLISNTLNIQGLNGSYKSYPTMRIYFKDGTKCDFHCYYIKQQVDVTNELSELLEGLKNKGVLELNIKANRDIIYELKDVLNLISLIK